MKILQIKILNHANGSMKYPEGYSNIDNCLEHLYYDDLATGICWLFILLRDEDGQKITNMENVTELTFTQARKLLEKYELQTEEITDEAAVRRIEIQVKAGLPLSDKDKEIIDPNNSVPGINYRKRFIDRIKIRLGI